MQDTCFFDDCKVVWTGFCQSYHHLRTVKDSLTKVSNALIETTLCTVCNSSVNINCVSLAFWITKLSHPIKEKHGKDMSFMSMWWYLDLFVSSDKSALKKEWKTWERRWNENNSKEKEIIFFPRLMSEWCIFLSPFSYSTLSPSHPMESFIPKTPWSKIFFTS